MAYISIGLAECGFFAPLYFLRLFLNHRRLSKVQHEEPNITSELTS